MNKSKQLRTHGNNWAIFQPSISPMYTLVHGKGWKREPIPFGDLNFLDPNSPHYFYPYALYSAGHAYLNPAMGLKNEPMVNVRDREKTILVCDSGGFQAATGVLNFDWANPMGDKANKKRLQLLHWLERTGDYSMILDWPAWAINSGRLPQTLMTSDPTTNPLQVTHDPFNNCLKGTIWNNEFFMENRTAGATKFLNVLQGRNVEEAHTWYEAVKNFSSKEKYGEKAFEGWALGGSTGGNPAITARLLIKLRDEKHLDGDDRWIHVLGRSRMTTAVYLTSVNKALKKHVNDNVQISFDAASAFLHSANGNYVTGWKITPDSMVFRSTEIPMHAKYIGSKEPFIYANLPDEVLNDPAFYYSPMSKNLTMGDIILPPKEGSKKTYSLDTASYYYLMAHNVQIQIAAINDACSRVDTPEGKKTIPSIFVEFDDFINELLITENPMSLIDKQASMFQYMIDFRAPGAGKRSGVSALEDNDMFPKVIRDAVEIVGKPEERNPAKEAKTLYSFYDELIVEPKASNG